MSRLRFGELAIVQANDIKLVLQRRAMKIIGLAAQSHGNRGARAGCGRLLDRLRIVQANEGVGEPLTQNCVRQMRAVGRRPATHVVSHIEQTNRALQRLAAMQGLFDRDHPARKVLAVLPQVTAQSPGLLGGEFRVVIRDRDRGGTHFFDVRIRKSKQDAVGEHAGGRQQLVGQLIQRREVRLACQLPFDIDCHCGKRGGLSRLHFAAQGLRHQPRSVDAARPLIQVRIRTIRDQRVRRVDHPRRKVGVGVERADQRHVLARIAAATRRARNRLRPDVLR